jgi:hypothetical protein
MPGVSFAVAERESTDENLTLSPRSSSSRSSRGSRVSFAPDDYLTSYFDEPLVDGVERGDDKVSSPTTKGRAQGAADSWVPTGLIRKRNQPFVLGPVPPRRRRPFPTLPTLF